MTVKHDENTPVSAEDFAREMARLGISQEAPFIAAAVSGGGDSMALAALLHGWTAGRGGRMLALTVDHGLRPDSADEARRTGAALEERGIAHRILVWEGGKPETRIQERARQARHDLLAAACRAENCPALAFAHNLEDQMETFWMRLAHGSGVDGLAGMAAVRTLPPLPSGEGRGEGAAVEKKALSAGVTALTPALSRREREQEGGLSLLRPLLSFSRARLRATCRAQGIGWIEDPSNENKKFLRVRLRGFEETLAAEGLTPERLSRTVHKMAEAREALEVFAGRAARECLKAGAAGETEIDVTALRAYPREIQRRVLAAALCAARPQDYPPGFEALEDLRAALAGEDFRGRTLAGCEISPRKGFVRIRPEKDTAA